MYKRPRFMRELLVQILAGLIAAVLLAAFIGSCSIQFTLQAEGTGEVARPKPAVEKEGEPSEQEPGALTDSLLRNR